MTIQSVSLLSYDLLNIVKVTRLTPSQIYTNQTLHKTPLLISASNVVTMNWFTVVDHNNMGLFD
uniref:Uncharacterized protein n=1 Tax=Arundo donax TaxID=35708 RepID=A0A0A9C7E2_ARUDO